MEVGAAAMPSAGSIDGIKGLVDGYPNYRLDARRLKALQKLGKKCSVLENHVSEKVAYIKACHRTAIDMHGSRWEVEEEAIEMWARRWMVREPVLLQERNGYYINALSTCMFAPFNETAFWYRRRSAPASGPQLLSPFPPGSSAQDRQWFEAWQDVTGAYTEEDLDGEEGVEHTRECIAAAVKVLGLDDEAMGGGGAGKGGAGARL